MPTPSKNPNASSASVPSSIGIVDGFSSTSLKPAA